MLSTGVAFYSVGKLFGELGQRYAQRPGGYLRILKCGFRPGDNAPMAYVELVDRALLDIEKIPVPVIAAVNGACIGYGLTAAVACDFVIASERATFSWPEVTIGIPTIVGAIRLPRKVAWADAMELPADQVDRRGVRPSLCSRTA